MVNNSFVQGNCQSWQLSLYLIVVNLLNVLISLRVSCEKL